MKTYKILIDRKSIKDNPNAGMQDINEYISTTATIVLRQKHENLEKEYPLVRLVGINGSTSRTEYRYMIHGNHTEVGPIIEKIIAQFGKNVHISLENNFEEIHLLTSEPAFLFEHKKTKVQCQHCKSKFWHTQLRDFDDWDDEGCYIGRSNICPECDKEDACELEFESFESVALKEANLPKLVVR